MHIIAKIMAAACLLLASCDANAPPASEQEKNTAIRAWQDCLVEKVPLFDDGVSDAMSIARAIAPMCHDLYRQVIRNTIQGQNVDVQRMLIDRMQEREAASAAPAVLIVRKAHQ